ncbi:MAG: Ig-like domain-containing protein [Patescibacteria group bacterium]|nr:Ig-like domain-containing protein [Patescibacteria group bacterium]MDD5121422.1 Ig-like domain-containing protein [Patescibacteria group bacterium]MDD5221892.1 Ig-like domain-containing protein [Patescibacteria group bacterium]MDD5395659.1 Ig-like domain-containing protein [Patescibacteria group bacterium]
MRNLKFGELFFSARTKKLFSLAFLFFILLILVGQFSVAHAQPPMNEGLEQFSNTTELPSTPLPIIIGRIVRFILGFLGLIAVVIVVYGGFIWMTSGGNEEKITRAKKLMAAGIIGLLIIILAYAFASFIINAISQIISGIAGNGGEPGGPGILPDDFKVSRILTTHEGPPQNYHQSVYLCSAVQPIFNHRVKPDNIQQLVQDNLLKVESGGTFTGTWQVLGNALVFKHDSLFASETDYTVHLPKQIGDNGGKTLKKCEASNGCTETDTDFTWRFTTGIHTDTSKPYITSSYPISKQNDPNYPDRNVDLTPLIDVNFSEPVDATTVMDSNNNPIAANIWVSRLDGRGGLVVEQIPATDWLVDIEDTGFKIYLRDTVQLKPFTWYRIHVSGIKDLCSNIMDPDNVEWEFQTNDHAPGISSYYPTGEKVCSSTNIGLTFGTSMENNLVLFRVKQGDNLIFEINKNPNIKGPVVISNQYADLTIPDLQTKVFIINPRVDLTPNLTYQIEMTSDLVINQKGDTLGKTWSFKTTTAANCLCAPWINRVSPAQGPSGQCITVFGECFTGTPSHSAAPKNNQISFLIGPSVVNSPVEYVSDNYLTTTVPDTGEDLPVAAKVRLTIVYSSSGEEETSNSDVTYTIDRSGSAQGPCLWVINPSSGYRDKTNIELNGIRLGNGGGEKDAVKFYNEAAVSNCPGTGCNWSDTKINNFKVPSLAGTGDVYVSNNNGNSNALPFTVLEQLPGPGEVCSDGNVCPNGSTRCQGEPTYTCRVNNTDCRCCCNPTEQNTCPGSLQCMANQSPCTGGSRGLCCGCQTDEQCGTGMGCGILDTNKCCHAQPIIESKNPDDNQIGVCRNAALVAVFNQKMDEASLNWNNIKFEICDDNNCANGTSVPATLTINDLVTKTGFTINPCLTNPLLEANRWYRIMVTGKKLDGQPGDGVRSDKGVSMLGVNSWVFQTGDELCQIDRIDVNPANKMVKVGAQQRYTANAYDDQQPVCVASFDWDSSAPVVATVEPIAGLETTASALSQGQTNISASTWIEIPGKLGQRRKITGLGVLTVKLTDLAVEEDSTCEPPSQIYSTPNPRPNYQQACLNIKVGARFNKNVDDGRINGTNLIKVYNCGSDQTCSHPTEVGAKDVYVYPVTLEKEAFVFEPTQNLSADTYYEVIVPGGEAGVIGEDGSSMAQDYVWQFKTKNDSVCPVESVAVLPIRTQLLNINDTQKFDSEALGEACQMLTGSYTWQWSSGDTKIATVSPTGPNNSTTATAKGLGETNITAATSGKSNQAYLVVSPAPTIISSSRFPAPNSTNICRNAFVLFTFDQEMDLNTINTSMATTTTVTLWGKNQDQGSPTSSLWNLFKNLVLKLRDNLINVSQAAPQGPPKSEWTQIAGEVKSQVISIGGIDSDSQQKQTLVRFVPSSALDSQRLYEIRIVGGPNGVKSKYGVSMAQDQSWQFTTGNKICQIQRVQITPQSYIFSQARKGHDFFATAYARDNQPISPITGVYTWTWAWTVKDNLITVTGDQDNPSRGAAVAGSTNGDTVLTAEAVDSLNQSFTNSAAVRVFICENPWVYPRPNDTNFYNFQLNYCRDGSPLLPALPDPVNAAKADSELKVSWLFNVPNTSDVIGLRIYDNFDHLTPAEWYKVKINSQSNPSAAPSVDDYQAIKDGRTTYVGATNVDFGLIGGGQPKLYSNIFLLSYNDNASQETIKIVNDLIKYWTFNINVRGDKMSLVHDLSRLVNFNQLNQLLSQYRAANNDFPKLISGIYVPGMTTSRWSSWQDTLGDSLGSALPIDPINTFANRNNCSGQKPYSCCADCPVNDPQCQGRCYNSAPDKLKYECVAGSHVYQYMYKFFQGNKGYALYSNFEYREPNNWQHNCASYNQTSTCSKHNWCAWINGSCKAKDLNFTGNACSSPSSCSCFNMQYLETYYYQQEWGQQQQESQK